MLKRYFLWFCLLFSATLSPMAFANFGFGPCCPPSVCGIIPCDSGCAGAAINQMGTNVANSLNQLNSAYQNLTSAAQDAIDSMNNLGTDVNDALLQQNQDLLDGLSASTNKIELANVQASKSIERNTDHTVKSFVLALKEIEIARAASENNRFFGDMAQPISGETGADQASAVKRIYVQTNQLLEETTEGFLEYIEDSNGTRSGAGTGQHRMLSLKGLSDFNNLSRLLTASTLDEQDFQGLQTLVGLSVSRYPLPKKDDSPRYLDYELERKRYIAMLGIAYHSLILPATTRAGVDDGAWAKYYQDVNVNAEGKVGLEGFYEAEINGKLSDPEWWGSVLRLNPAGLEREKTYQAALSLQMKDRLGELSQTSNELMAILLAKKSEAKAKELKTNFEQL